MFDIKQFREELLSPALELIGHWSKSAEELLILTCAQESLGGTYFKQVSGPALGIFQMEPATHEYMWNTYLPHQRQHETYKILNAVNIAFKPPAATLKYNILYATLMARVFYLRFEEPLPKHDDAKGLANYWKKYWNTSLGAGKPADALVNYYRFKKTIPTEKKIIKKTK